MNIKEKTYKEEFKEISIEELINHIVEDEGEYFLSFDDEDMLDEFNTLAKDLGVDEIDLENDQEEILTQLQALRKTISEKNYSACIDEAVGYIESCYEDFDDVCMKSVYGEYRDRVFKAAIERLYKKHCNEKVG